MEQLTREDYSMSLQDDIENASWAKKFSESEDWKKLASFIAANFPTINPYDMEDINKLKYQGGYIAGMTLVERILNNLVEKGKYAQDELKNNPHAE